jgi:uncharacterized membrane protein YccC
MDSLAALSAAMVRMLDEPASKQRAAEDINLFVVQNYLLVAHVAALRAILRRHVKDIPAGPVNALLEYSHTQVCQPLARALAQTWTLQGEGTDAEPDAPPPAMHNDAVAWPGWPLVQRRIRLLQADAEKIIVHSEAIGRGVA